MKLGAVLINSDFRTFFRKLHLIETKELLPGITFANFVEYPGIKGCAQNFIKAMRLLN